MAFSFCTPRLAVGGGPVLVPVVELGKLANEGITHIISFRQKQESILAEHPSFTMLWNPTEDDGKPKPLEWFDKSIRFALAALAVPYKKVYCHCYHGSNRSASTALAILMAQGRSYSESLELVLRARPDAEVKYREDACNAVRDLGY